MDSSRAETGDRLLKCGQSSKGSRAIASNRSSCGRLAKPPFSPLPTALWRRHSRAILLLGLIATSETLSAPYNGRGSSAAGAHHHRAAADQHTPPPVTRTLRLPGSRFFATTQGPTTGSSTTPVPVQCPGCLSKLPPAGWGRLKPVRVLDYSTCS